MQSDIRPWGKWEELISDSTYMVKRLIIHPGKRISLQRHFKRSESWVIVQGQALFTLNETEKILNIGECVTINVKDVHRVENCGTVDLIIIETQYGECIETDIERLSDDWNRS
jgi:mannose-6-phosphate isomerase-like protein (cupin superfamily)